MCAWKDRLGKGLVISLAYCRVRPGKQENFREQLLPPGRWIGGIWKKQFRISALQDGERITKCTEDITETMLVNSIYEHPDVVSDVTVVFGNFVFVEFHCSSHKGCGRTGVMGTRPVRILIPGATRQDVRIANRVFGIAGGQ